MPFDTLVQPEKEDPGGRVWRWILRCSALLVFERRRDCWRLSSFHHCQYWYTFLSLHQGIERAGNETRIQLTRAVQRPLSLPLNAYPRLGLILSRFHFSKVDTIKFGLLRRISESRGTVTASESWSP